jgi:hypothetical protein
MYAMECANLFCTTVCTSPVQIQENSAAMFGPVGSAESDIDLGNVDGHWKPDCLLPKFFDGFVGSKRGSVAELVRQLLGVARLRSNGRLWCAVWMCLLLSVKSGNSGLTFIDKDDSKDHIDLFIESKFRTQLAALALVGTTSAFSQAAFTSSSVQGALYICLLPEVTRRVQVRPMASAAAYVTTISHEFCTCRLRENGPRRLLTFPSTRTPPLPASSC